MSSISSSGTVFASSARRAAVASLALGALLATAPGLALADVTTGAAAEGEGRSFALLVEQIQQDSQAQDPQGRDAAVEKAVEGADASQAPASAEDAGAAGPDIVGDAPATEEAGEADDTATAGAADNAAGTDGSIAGTEGASTEGATTGEDTVVAPALPDADGASVTPPPDTNEVVGADDNASTGTPDADKGGVTAESNQHDATASADTSASALNATDKGAPSAATPDASATSEAAAPASASDATATTTANAETDAAAEAEATALLTGWQTIAGQRYYYGSNGKPLTGTQTISDKTYYFDSEGKLRTGFRYLGDGVVSFFSLDSGQQLTGQQYIHGTWRNLDATSGLSTGLAAVQEGQSGVVETKLYDAFDGSIQTGQQYVNGSWHYFDEGTGRMYSRAEEIQRVLDVAWSYLGGSESLAWSFLVEACEDGGNWCEYGPCISTVRHFFKAAGMDRFLADGLVDGWPHTYLDYMRATNQVSWTAYVGSIAFFDFPNSFHQRIGVSTCHAEIVVEMGDYYYKTIGSIYDGITLHTYYFGDGYTQEFGLPAYLR